MQPLRTPDDLPPHAFGRRRPGPGHPFRRALPASALRPLPALEPEVAEAMARAEFLALRSPPVDPRAITLQDVKDFLLAYCACFVAVLAFIS